MPDGKPAPYVLTAEDVCAFLRLDGTPSRQRLDAIRAAGLRGRRVGAGVRFILPDVLKYLELCEAPVQRGGRSGT